MIPKYILYNIADYLCGFDALVVLKISVCYYRNFTYFNCPRRLTAITLSCHPFRKNRKLIRKLVAMNAPSDLFSFCKGSLQIYTCIIEALNNRNERIFDLFSNYEPKSHSNLICYDFNLYLKIYGDNYNAGLRNACSMYGRNKKLACELIEYYENKGASYEDCLGGACESRDIEFVKKIIAKGGYDFEAGALYAAEKDDLEIFDLMVENGAGITNFIRIKAYVSDAHKIIEKYPFEELSKYNARLLGSACNEQQLLKLINSEQISLNDAAKGIITNRDKNLFIRMNVDPIRYFKQICVRSNLAGIQYAMKAGAQFANDIIESVIHWQRVKVIDFLIKGGFLSQSECLTKSCTMRNTSIVKMYIKKSFNADTICDWCTCVLKKHAWYST